MFEETIFDGNQVSLKKLCNKSHSCTISTLTASIISNGSHDSRILQLPDELILMILKWINDPITLWFVFQTCKKFRFLINENMWLNVYKAHNPTWSRGVEVNHLKGCEMWSRMVLRDYMRRTFLLLDQTSITSNFVKNVYQDHQALFPLYSSSSDKSQSWKNKCNSTNISYLPYIQASQYGNNLDKQVRLKANIRSAVQFQPKHMLSTIPDQTHDQPRWRNVGPPIFTDSDNQEIFVGYMQAKSIANHTDHQIVLYRPENHSEPIANIPNSFWVHEDADKELDAELATANLGPAQLIEMKCFKISNNQLRIVFVIAFSERNVNTNDRDMYTSDIFSLFRVVEVYIPFDDSLANIPYKISRRGKVETLVPRFRQITRIRIAKIYSSLNTTTGRSEERIALFGIYQGVKLLPVLMTSPLFEVAPINFQSSRHSSWESYVLGGNSAIEPSCMVLFPNKSEFGHLLVIMNRHGDGEIWNWERKGRVAVLNLGIRDEAQKDSSVSLHLEEVDVSEFEAEKNPYAKSHRNHLYYWGVHVNWAIEEPTNNNNRTTVTSVSAINRRQNGDFRIVALADGESTECETSWFHIDSKKLRKYSDLNYPINWKIYATSRHFEYCTRGVFSKSLQVPIISNQVQLMDIEQPQAEGNPLTFIAYLFWDHYRITLTSNYGICIFDLDRETRSDFEASQNQKTECITMIEGAEEDPLIDITTISNCLYLTRKYSHMVLVL